MGVLRKVIFCLILGTGFVPMAYAGYGDGGISVESSPDAASANTWTAQQTFSTITVQNQLLVGSGANISTVTGSGFSGNGSGLTNVSASNIALTSGAGTGKVLISSNTAGGGTWTQMTYNAPPSELYISTSDTNIVVITANSIGVEEYIAINVSTQASLALSGAGGLDTGVEAASTWYYGYLIYDSSGTNGTGFILSISSFNPTMPAGYNKKRRVYDVYNNSSSNLDEVQSFDGTEYMMTNAAASFSGDPGTGFTTVTLSTVTTPPIRMDVCVSIQAGSGVGGNGTVGLAPTGHNYTSGNSNIVVVNTEAASLTNNSRGCVRQNASRQIDVDATSAINAIAGGVFSRRHPFR